MMKKTIILMMFSVILGFSPSKSDKGNKVQLTINKWQLKKKE